jgi:hypothetical protein
VLNSPNDDSGFVGVAPDGLTLYFQSNRQVAGDTIGDHDLYVSAYDAPSGTWSAPAKVGGVTTNSNELTPSVRGDALAYAYAASGFPSTILLSAPFGSAPAAIPDVNVGTAESQSPVFSSDFCTLYFVSDRPGGLGALDVWEATRR